MQLIPVDASISRTPMPTEGKDLATVCVLCSHNCALRVDVQDGRITELRGDESSPISHGYLCNKAYSIPNYVQHAQRVQHPLRRKSDGTFERISWDTAIAEIAAKLNAIREAHTPRSIGLVGIGGQANHMDAPFGLGFLRSLGSRRWFNSFAQEKTQHALVDHWMFEASPCAFMHSDQANSKYMLVLGTNPRISNRGHNANDFFPAFQKDPTRTMVVVDPRETETTRGASKHLRIKPGMDTYLLLGMAAVIVQRELYRRDFVEQKTVGFDALREALTKVDIEEMARHSGISAAEIIATATDFAGAESASIFYDLGIEQSPYSTLNSYLIRVLLVLTGNVGKRGGNVFYETILPPVLDPALRHEPERAIASGIPGIPALGNFAMFSPTLVPEEILVDHPERLRAVIVEGSNPYLSFSDTQRWREARKHLDLFVVIELSMTETALDADYVLPAPSGYEKWEFAAFPKGYPEILLQVRPPVVPGPAEALPEPEIYARLAEAMRLFGDPPAELNDLAAQVNDPMGAAQFVMTLQMHGSGDANRMLFWAYRTLGPHLPAPSLAAIWMQSQLNALLRPQSVLRTLGPEWSEKSPIEIGLELYRRILAHPEGVEIARVDVDNNLDDHINFPDKKVRLAIPEMLEQIGVALGAPPSTEARFPFVLAAGLRTRWTANTIQRDPAWRKGRGPHCALNLSPADAQKLGVSEGQSLRLTTRRGSAVLPAQIDPKLQPGHVWIPNGFGVAYPSNGSVAVQGVNQNDLTDTCDRDPFTGVPYHRYVPCSIQPA